MTYGKDAQQCQDVGLFLVLRGQEELWGQNDSVLLWWLQAAVARRIHHRLAALGSDAVSVGLDHRKSNRVIGLQ